MHIILNYLIAGTHKKAKNNFYSEFEDNFLDDSQYIEEQKRAQETLFSSTAIFIGKFLLI